MCVFEALQYQHEQRAAGTRAGEQHRSGESSRVLSGRSQVLGLFLSSMSLRRRARAPWEGPTAPHTPPSSTPSPPPQGGRSCHTDILQHHKTCSRHTAALTVHQVELFQPYGRPTGPPKSESPPPACPKKPKKSFTASL